MRPTLLGLLRLRWVSQMSLADTEVHWHGKRVDLAFALRPGYEAGPVAAVELKVRDTRKAIQQAALNRFLTPSSWVATWTPPSAPLLQLAESEKVGIFLLAERGLYPVLFPARGEPLTDALQGALSERGRRVRDILSEIRYG